MGRGSALDTPFAWQGSFLSAFLDSNVLIRHLTGDPPAMARQATRLLESSEGLTLTDLIAAECVYVLESFYEVPAARVAEVMRSAFALESIVVPGLEILLRALELYEVARLDFADAYIVACAEHSGIGAVVSFDKGIDRVESVRRVTNV